MFFFIRVQRSQGQAQGVFYFAHHGQGGLDRDRVDLIEQAAEHRQLAEKDAQIAALKNRVAELENSCAARVGEQKATPELFTGEDDPDAVFKKVDSLLKSYLGTEAEEQ